MTMSSFTTARGLFEVVRRGMQKNVRHYILDFLAVLLFCLAIELEA